MEYVVLNDGDTYSSTDGAFVVLLNEEGEDKLMNTNSMKDVPVEGILTKISVADLLDCWFAHNAGFTDG